jgi:hypothetical protein
LTLPHTTLRPTLRTRTRFVLAAIGISAALALGVAPRLAFSDDVDTLFEQGTTALKKGDAKTAYEKLSAAWQSRQSVDIAANLAIAEKRLGKNREAAEHLAYAIAYFPPSGEPSARKEMETMLAELKKGLCELRIKTEEGATVRIDEKPVGLSPLNLPVYLEPGKHVFAAEKGSAKGSVTLHFQAGDSNNVVITMTITQSSATPSASASAPPTATGTATSTPPPDEPPPKWPGFLIGGLGFVGVAIGGGLMGASAAASTEAEDMASGLSGCPTQSPAGACGELADKVDSENTLHNAGLGTVVAGSVLLATGVALIIWSFSADDAPADEQPAASRPATGRLVPLADPTFLGLSYETSF